MATTSVTKARRKPASNIAPISQTASGIAPLKNRSQPKRTLTPANFFSSVTNMVVSCPVLGVATISPKITPALREKIFLGVSAINDCRYCKWGHTHWSLSQGVPLEEVNQILGLQVESLKAKNPAEAAAILFAQHYAEHLDQIDPESLKNLRKYYNDDEVEEILAYVRLMTFTNLLGNTADSFLDRLGRTFNSVFEDVVGAAAVPLALALRLGAKFDTQVGMEPGYRRRPPSKE